MSEYNVSRSTTIANDAEKRLLSRYRRRTKFKAWLRSYTDRHQEAEDLIWDLIEILDIDNAVGVWLDLLGKIVGQPRVSTDDEVYRLFIKARIRVNISHGTEDDVQELAFLLLAGTDWTTRSVYPNQVRVNVNESAGNELIIASLFKEVVAAAKSLRYEFSSFPRQNVFAFKYSSQANSSITTGKMAYTVVT